MNELQEQILALLVAKFQGVRKDGLQHLAAAIGGPVPCHSHPGPPRPGLLHRRYQPAENCPDGGRTQQQGQHCNPAGSAKYTPLL